MNTTSPVQSMACPHCVVPLVMSERQGVEIDYCPQCRGVWLDRGELDKILERASRDMASMAAAAAPAPAPTAAPVTAHYGHKPHAPYYKRRKSFLEELFD